MDQSTDFYGYLPSKPAALFGVAYFGAAAIACTLQIIVGRYPHYWMTTMALAGVGESLGWGARLWAHMEPDNWMPFMIQICSLAITPVFISAADYVLFCKIVQKTGGRLFHIPSKFFWIGFLVVDLISLSIQIVGGVEVSSAQDLDQLESGSRVMLDGIIFQFSNTVMFVALLLGTIVRLRMKDMRLVSVLGWPVMLALWISTVMVLFRNAYRIVELSGGWNGHVARTEWYLITFDMAPMAVAVGVFAVFSPSIFLSNDEYEEEGKKARLSDCIPLKQVNEMTV